MLRVYGGAGCRNSHRAKRWLDLRGMPFLFHDLCAERLDLPLEAWIDTFGWRNLIDKRTAAWRALSVPADGVQDRATVMELITQRPQLLKTPILGNDQRWLLGWNSANKVHLLAQVRPGDMAYTGSPEMGFGTALSSAR